MKFIQSSNEKNPILNLELIVYIEKVKQGLFFCSHNDNILWEGNQQELDQDWKTICDALNSDIIGSTNLHIIK